MESLPGRNGDAGKLMPTDLEKVVLGQEAIDYIVQSLRDGNDVSLGLLKTLDFGAGIISTYLPVGTAPQSITRFRSGGILESPPTVPLSSVGFGGSGRIAPLPNLDYLLTPMITDHLESGHSAVCLFENHISSPTDPWLSRARLHNLTFGKTVCHYLTQADSMDRELVEFTVRKAGSVQPPLLGILSRVEADIARAQTSSLAEAEFGAVVAGIEKLVVGAYDGEGFLLWEPRKGSQEPKN